VVTRRRERGYSLLEITVMLAVFGAVLAIFFILTDEMRKWEKRLPVNYMKHPQVSAVMARLRKDVLDAHLPSGPYVDYEGDFESGSKTLIIATILEVGTLQTVVWDFSKPGIVQRHAFTSGLKTNTWTARGIPLDFSKEVGIAAVEFEDRPYGVRIKAVDGNGKVSIDQILQPRSHTPEEVPPATTTT
jgi:hypothetical protein